MDEQVKIRRYLTGVLAALAAAAGLAVLFVNAWSVVWGIIFLFFYSTALAVIAALYRCRMVFPLLLPYVNVAAGVVIFRRLGGGVFTGLHYLIFAVVIALLWLWPTGPVAGPLMVLLPLLMIPVINRISAVPRPEKPWRISPLVQSVAAVPLAIICLVWPLDWYRSYKLKQFGTTLEQFENRPLPPKPYAVERLGVLPLDEVVRIEHFGLNRAWTGRNFELIDLIWNKLLERLMSPEITASPVKWLEYSRSFQRWFDEDFRIVTLYREQLKMLEKHLRDLPDEALTRHGTWAAAQERSMPEFNELRERVDLAHKISGRGNANNTIHKLLIRSVIYMPVIAVSVDDMRYARMEYHQLQPVLEERRRAYAEPSPTAVIAEYTLLEKYAYRLSEDLANLRVARTAIALERYHRANGKYPQSLGELAPGYLNGIPVDPYTGKALKYIPGECVYSVGRNLADDRGVDRLATRSMEYDIVCRLDWNPSIAPDF